MTRRLITLIAFVLLFCLLIGGCAPAPSSSPSAPSSSSAAPVVSNESASQAPAAERPVIRIASLKGPTTMGMVKLVSDSEEKKTVNDYNVTMVGTADEIVAMIANKTVDAAAVPCNLAAVLYQKTNGAIQTAAINTLGVLYVVETGDTVKSVADLKGKTVYSTGKGTTPEYALNFILAQNGLDPQKDLTVEFKSEATEVASLLSESKD
jgi:NitT/TauT family transport system substrate-binding protein